MLERSTSLAHAARLSSFCGASLRRWCVALFWIGLVSVAGPAAAQKTPDADLAKEQSSTATTTATDTGTGKTLQERIRAVSRRAFLKAGRFEFTPGVGFSADDPFFRSWTVGARGAWHFSEEFALDFGGAGAIFQEQQDIFRAINVDPADLATDIKARLADDSLLAYVDAGITFSPLYGKVALASEFVSHFDVFVSAGAAGIIDTAQVFSPGVELGLGSRVYLNRFLAARVDVRNYTYASGLGGQVAVNNLLMLNLGIAIYFPLDFDYSAETLGAKD
jgi:outer membrane beta-barrel protein